jgi:hypothetical protein
VMHATRKCGMEATVSPDLPGRRHVIWFVNSEYATKFMNRWVT